MDIVVVEERNTDYIAYLRSDPETWESAETGEMAVAKLIISIRVQREFEENPHSEQKRLIRESIQKRLNVETQ